MKIRNLVQAVVFTIFCSLAVAAQGDGPPPPGQNNFDAPDGNRGQFIARALGLSEEQRLQIRNINQKQRQHLRVAQMRLRAARAAADLAIYDDNFDETQVGERIREVAVAQAEITKIRMMSEVAVRQVLSPDQLVKFRDLRARFAEQRRRRQERRRANQRLRRDSQKRNPDRKPANRPRP